MRSLMPWSGMTGLKQDMDRVLDRFFESRWESCRGWETGCRRWTSPRQGLGGGEGRDPGHGGQGHPGLTARERAHDHREKKQEKEEKDERYHRVERSYGSFARSMRLPAGVEAGKVNAAFKNGVLIVTLPKTAAAKATPIPIKAKS